MGNNNHYAANLKNIYNAVGFRQHREAILNQLWRKEVSFFSIQINFPELWDSNNPLYDRLPLNYEEAVEWVKLEVDSMVRYFEYINFLEFIFISVEKQTKDSSAPSYGFPFFNILLAVNPLLKNLDGYLKERIHKHLIGRVLRTDTRVCELTERRQVSYFWDLITRESELDRAGASAFSNYFFYKFGYNYECGPIYGSMADFFIWNREQGNVKFGAFSTKVWPYLRIKPCFAESSGKDESSVALNLIYLYFQLVDIYKQDDKLYKKVNGFYKYLGDFSYVKENIYGIVNELKKEFSFQLVGVDIYFFILNNIESIELNLKRFQRFSFRREG